MFIRTFDEGEAFRCAGNNFAMLLPREVTSQCEVVLEHVGPGRTTPPNAHAAFQQIYLVLSGKAEIHIGSEHRQIEAPAVAFIPQSTEHYVVNLSQIETLTYIYISVWPNGVPQAEINEGWRSVYDLVIKEYANRGYSQDGFER